MSVPKDPVMLLSYINTQLRDFYPSLEDCCKALDIDCNYVTEKLLSINYKYDREINKFI